MAQFSVKIMRLTGSVLSENQQPRNHAVKRVAFGRLAPPGEQLACLNDSHAVLLEPGIFR
jgi:hypothetical protein